MARTKTVTLSDGREIVVRSLSLRNQRLLIRIIADIVKLLSSLNNEDDGGRSLAVAAEFIEEKFDNIIELIENSLVDESDIDFISGIDDTVEVLMAIYEVNGGQNLVKRLGFHMETLAGGLQGMAEQVSPEKEDQVGPRPVAPNTQA